MPRSRRNNDNVISPLELSIIKNWIIFKHKHFQYLLQYLLFFISSFCSIWSKQSKIADFEPKHWIIIFVSPILLTAFTYIKDNPFNKRNLEKLLNHRVIFEITGSGIADIRDVIYKTNTRPKNYIKDSLTRIQHIVELTLKEKQVPTGDISVNFMERKDNKLTIIEFDLQTTRHEYISLDIDPENPKPGGPKAVVTKKIDYVHNTGAKNYKEYFTNGRYMSFFSYPILDRNGDIFGVINVDSTLPDQFKNKQYIDDIIKPAIVPIINLLELENCIKTNNHQANG